MARRDIGMRLGPVEVALLVKMVERAVVEAFSTALKYAAKDQGSGDEVFTTPPAAPETGSAGGSITSAS